MSTWIAGKGTIPAVTTNYDRIISKTPEEMAEWLVIVEQRILEVKPMLERPALYADWLNWLKQEVQSEQEKRC